MGRRAWNSLEIATPEEKERHEWLKQRRIELKREAIETAQELYGLRKRWAGRARSMQARKDKSPV